MVDSHYVADIERERIKPFELVVEIVRCRACRPVVAVARFRQQPFETFPGVSGPELQIRKLGQYDDPVPFDYSAFRPGARIPCLPDPEKDPVIRVSAALQSDPSGRRSRCKGPVRDIPAFCLYFLRDILPGAVFGKRDRPVVFIPGVIVPLVLAHPDGASVCRGQDFREFIAPAPCRYGSAVGLVQEEFPRRGGSSRAVPVRRGNREEDQGKSYVPERIFHFDKNIYLCRRILDNILHI